jgi:hypothetical protein
VRSAFIAARAHLSCSLVRGARCLLRLAAEHASLGRRIHASVRAQPFVCQGRHPTWSGSWRPIIPDGFEPWRPIMLCMAYS